MPQLVRKPQPLPAPNSRGAAASQFASYLRATSRFPRYSTQKTCRRSQTHLPAGVLQQRHREAGKRVLRRGAICRSVHELALEPAAVPVAAERASVAFVLQHCPKQIITLEVCSNLRALERQGRRKNAPCRRGRTEDVPCLLDTATLSWRMHFAAADTHADFNLTLLCHPMRRVKGQRAAPAQPQELTRVAYHFHHCGCADVVCLPPFNFRGLHREWAHSRSTASCRGHGLAGPTRKDATGDCYLEHSIEAPHQAVAIGIKPK